MTISFGIQKGGSGKTTTSGIVASLLSADYKVLAVDMDGQGNLSQMLTGIDDPYEFGGKTTMEAIKAEDAKPFIRKVTDTLDVLVSDELITTLASHLYLTVHNKQKKETNFALKAALSTVQDDYDYIIIDTPPALGEQTYNALTASDYVVVMFEPSKFCHSAILSFFETIEHIQDNLNPDLKVAGILRTLIDNRRADNSYYFELISEEYPELLFGQVIQRTAAVARAPFFGLTKSNSELKQVNNQYLGFVKELINVVDQR
ncbi:ParA family protein [Paenibacillus sp. FSL R7-0302]|uniref:ParA family protein n=1 Tax=Paenibacillus sp. FSL R7-0302 TaxID=2921681 RepID=UPI0030FC9429